VRLQRPAGRGLQHYKRRPDRQSPADNQAHLRWRRRAHPDESPRSSGGQAGPKYSLAPVAARLSQLLGQDVVFAKDCVGKDATAKAAALKSGQCMLLENCVSTKKRPSKTRPPRKTPSCARPRTTSPRPLQLWPISTSMTPSHRPPRQRLDVHRPGGDERQARVIGF